MFPSFSWFVLTSFINFTVMQKEMVNKIFVLKTQFERLEFELETAKANGEMRKKTLFPGVK